MAKKEYSHLVKPLRIQPTPPGLYGEPRFWMEGKDLEGFNGQFSYGFFKKPTVCHPMEGAIVHPYDECLIFAGTDNNDILYLGAEVSVEMGEEREEHVFDKPSVILVPKGTPHGPIKVRCVDRPIVHYSISLAPEYRADAIPQSALAPATTGTKYSRLIKPLVTSRKMKREGEGSGMGYESILDSNGVMHSALVGKAAGMGPGNADHLVWLFGEDVEHMNVNFTWGFYTGSGKWHRDGESHTHPEEEILVWVGLDPDNLEYLGAECEMAMGPNDERHFSNVPFVCICPKGFPHLPEITRWVDKPYSFIVCCMSEEHDSPWVEA
jgi:hypothetical protein